MSDKINILVPEKSIKSIVETDKAIAKLNVSYSKLLADMEKGKEILKGSKISVDSLGEAQKKSKVHTVEMDKIGKQLIATEQKLKDLDDVRSKAIIKTKTAIQQKTAETKRAIIQEKALKGSYQQINAALNSNIAKYKNLTAEQRKNSSVGGKLLGTIKKQDQALKRLDTQMGRSQRHVGNYGRAITTSAKSLLGAFGLIGGAMMFVKVLRSSMKTITDFEKTMSEVEAITGATGDKLQALSDDALGLGSSTKFTATEVAKLQVELGRLGFTTDQILDATEAILNLAAATNSDLARAAEVAGNTVRAFNLDASETGRVSDVMAQSFSETALNLERFSIGMAKLAPVADSAGVSLERTTALMGQLVNRGVDASTAGTSLRNVFLELSKQGLTWDEAMGKINDAQDKNKVSLELFGKRASTAGLIIAGLADETDTLTKSFEGSEGAAKRMADTMQDNVVGDATRAKSAWEGLILSFNKGKGVVSELARSVLQFGTRIFGLLTPMNKASEGLKDQQKEILVLTSRFTDLNTSEEDMLEIQKELNRINPDILEGIDAQNIDYKKLSKNIEEVNTQLVNQIAIAQLSEEETKNADKLARNRIKTAESELAIRELLVDINQKIATSEGTLEEKIERSIKALQDEGAVLKKSVSSQSTFVDSRSKEQKQLDKLLDQRNILNSNIEKENILTDKSNTLLQKQQELRKILGITIEKDTGKDLEKEKENKIIEALGQETEITKGQQRELDKRLAAQEKHDDEVLKSRNKLAADLIKVIEDESDFDEDMFFKKLEDELQGTLTFNEELVKAREELNDQIAEADDKLREEKAEKDREQAEKDKQLRSQNIQDGIELGAIAANAAIGIYQNRLDAQSQALEIDKQRQLALAGEDEIKREAIEEKFAKKENELRVKQAKADKLAALFNIAINTAQAIMKLTAQTGVLAPLAIPLVIAAGVAQAAVVLSQKIPTYEAGTKGQFSTPSTFIAGEAGKEVLQSPSGTIIPVIEPTVFKNAAGYRVYSNPELEKMAGKRIGYDSPDLKVYHEMTEELKAIKSAIIKKPVFIMDKDMNVFGVQQNSHVERWLKKHRYGK